MATSNPCCDITFTCVQCPIITGPDCVPPNNMMPGQLWYNPCTCTYYFECGEGFDEDNNCESLTPLNFKPGAGIQYSGDCENGHFISVKIEPGIGLGFTGTGQLTIVCADLIEHCQLWSRGNLTFNPNQFDLECDVDGNCQLVLNPCEVLTWDNLIFNPDQFQVTEDVENCTKTVSIELPPETTEWYSDLGALGSVAICVSLSGGAPYATFQGRDGTIVNGSIIDGGAGAYYTINVEATRPPELVGKACTVEVEMRPNCNSANAAQPVSFRHIISPLLAELSYGLGEVAGTSKNVAWTVVPGGGAQGNAASNSGVDIPWAQQSSGAAMYRQQLAVGQSAQTLYAQWWAFLTGNAVIHGGASIGLRWYIGESL